MKHRWTTDNIPDQPGKIIIVTGANSGIGYETALALAARGATVIIASRSPRKGRQAVDAIHHDFRNARVEFMRLDLADLESVRRFAAEFHHRFARLDRLINNAGVMTPPFSRTADGFENQFGTNHLGHFALTGRLLDIIRRTPKARIVTVSSVMHYFGRIDFANLNGEVSYHKRKAYAQSKLANLLFTYELQRRLAMFGANAIAVAAHPGWTATGLQRHSGFLHHLNPFMGQRPAMGALPTLYAAISPEVKGGNYIGPGGWLELSGHPRKVSSNARSHNRAVAAKLWRVSENLTGVNYDNTLRQDI